MLENTLVAHNFYLLGNNSAGFAWRKVDLSFGMNFIDLRTDGVRLKFENVVELAQMLYMIFGLSNDDYQSLISAYGNEKVFPRTI